jgi:hypothetical protein
MYGMNCGDDDIFECGEFTRSRNGRGGEYHYFIGGTQMHKSDGQQQIILTGEYLRATHSLKERVRKDFMMDACDLGLPNLQLSKVFSEEEKSSASKTIICAGTVFGENVIVKISFLSKNRSFDDSLALEVYIYQKMTPILAEYTPNVMSFLANGLCEKEFIVRLEDLVKKGVRGDVADNLWKEIQKKDDKFHQEYDVNSARMLIA